MIEYIYTADDFGPIEFINKGIIQGVKQGVINSVQVFANFNRELLEASLMDLNKSVLDGKELDLGVHLTITSGKPLTLIEGVLPKEKWEGFLNSEDNFHDLPYYSFKHKAFLACIETEFIYQRDRLLDAVNVVNKRLGNEKLKVTVISNHHNLVSSDFDLLKVFLNTAILKDESGAKVDRLACRTMKFRPTKSTRLYYGLAIFLKPLFKRGMENPKKTDNKLRNQINRLNNGFVNYRVPEGEDVSFKTTLYGDMTFYRTLGSKSWWMKFAWLRYLGGFERRQKNKLLEMYERALNHKVGNEVAQDAKRIYEYIFHLGDLTATVYPKQEELDRSYTGVGALYFDDRKLELLTLIACKNIMDDTKKASWTDCPMVTFHATQNEYQTRS